MERLKDITVLITAAGNVYMPGITSCLRNNGERRIRLIGADMNDDPTMLEMFDAYYSVPRGDDPDYINSLFEICNKENVDIVLPIMSVELEALAYNKKRFSEIGTVVSVSDLPQLRIANNKRLLMEFLKENGMPCAEFQIVNSVKNMEEAVKEMGYPNVPVCIKTTDSSGSRGFRILDASKSQSDLLFRSKPTSCYTTLKEMKKALNESNNIPDLIVMEYLPGSEYTVDLLADKGRVLVSCCRKSLLMENSIMMDGVVDQNEAVLTLCSTVVEKLELDGNIGFDVREKADGTPILMESNPRITAGIPIFYAAGVNLPYLCVKKILGEKLPEVDIKEGVKMKRRYMEMYCC